MAEVFGVAASAVGIPSVVLEMAKSIKKLKDFCRDVKTAPQAIQEFADEVNDISTLLAQLENCGLLQQPAGAPTPQLCFSHCRRANKLISAVISELQRSLKEHGWRVKLNFPLKKERMKELTDKLERSKSSLSLACSVYGLWSSREHAQVQERLLRDMMALVQTQQAQYLPRPKSSRTIAAPAVSRSDSPAWSLSELIWDVCLKQFTRGWKHYFRQYKVVPDDHQAMVSCCLGDLLGLQRAICRKEIGVHDRNTFGETLFAVAVRHGRIQIARELRQIGADYTSTDQRGSSPFDLFWSSLAHGLVYYGQLLPSYDLEDIKRDVAYLADDCGLSPDMEDEETIIDTFKKPSSSWTTRDIFILTTWFWNKDMVKSVLQYPHDNSIWRMQNDHGRTILHKISGEVGLQWTRRVRLPNDQIWLLKRAIHGGSDLHAMASNSPIKTPLHEFLLYLVQLNYHEWNMDLAYLTVALQDWIAALADAGIDLAAYGEREMNVWNMAVSIHICNYAWPRVFAFTHGRSVTDWKVLVEHPGDSFAGEFWHRIEHPEIDVPGAWIESHEELWDDKYFERRRRFRMRHKYISEDYYKRAGGKENER